MLRYLTTTVAKKKPCTSIEECYYLSRDGTRASHAVSIDEFPEGERLTKCSEPYGENRVLLNRLVVLKHKHYIDGTLAYVIVSDGRVDGALHLDGPYFEGWINSDLLQQCRQARRQSVFEACGAVLAVNGVNETSLQLPGSNLTLLFDADYCRCQIVCAEGHMVDQASLSCHTITTALFPPLSCESGRDLEPMTGDVEVVLELRNKEHEKEAQSLESFSKSDRLVKRCRPYGRANVFFNKVVEVKHMVIGAGGQLYRVGVQIVGESGEMMWLDGQYFNGWTRRI
jgi:hypothetical protein